MKANLATDLAYEFGSEGSYTDDPQDTGGPTNYGITQRTLAAWRKRPVTAADVKALTLAEAQDILASEFAAPIRFDELPDGVDYAVLDYAVNSGPAQAARDIQRLVGVVPDGIIGTKTLDAIAAADEIKLINAYCDARLTFMKSLGNWSTFGKGWTSRVELVRTRATAMAAGVAVQALPSAQAVPVAKAPPTDMRVAALPQGKANILAATGGISAGVAATATTMASQIAPIADHGWLMYVAHGFVGVAALAGIVGALAGLGITISHIKSGQAAT